MYSDKKNILQLVALLIEHGVTVRTDTPEHFMDDLKKYGYITG